MRSSLRAALLAGVVMTLTSMSIASADALEADPAPALALRSDGTDLTWSSDALDAATEGASVTVELDTTEAKGLRGDVVRLEVGTDAGIVELSTPSPFGGVEVVGTTGPDAPAEVFVQTGRVIPITFTPDAPGAYRLDVVATVPGRSGALSAATSLDITTAGTPPAPAAARSLDASADSALLSRSSVASPETVRQAGDPVVIASGHVDMGPRVVDGAWRIQLKDDTVSPAVWRELSDVVLHAVSASKSTVPPGSQFDFLGAEGSDVWLLPQAQQADIIWPGWNTQDPSIAPVATGPVTWTLHGVDGPGSFALFLTGSFGTPEVLFDSDRRLPQQHEVALGTHVHGNWAFTEAGTYRLDVEMSAPTASGTATDRRTLTFAVGDADPGQVARSTTSTTASGGASQEVTTNRGTGPSRPAAAGAMADTGIGALGRKVALGVGLVAVGLVILVLRQRNQLENGSQS